MLKRHSATHSRASHGPEATRGTHGVVELVRLRELVYHRPHGLCSRQRHAAALRLQCTDAFSAFICAFRSERTGTNGVFVCCASAQTAADDDAMRCARGGGRKAGARASAASSAPCQTPPRARAAAAKPTPTPTSAAFPALSYERCLDATARMAFGFMGFPLC